MYICLLKVYPKYRYILILVKDTGSACVTISAYPQFLLCFEDDNRYLLHNVSVKIKLIKHFEHNKSSENVSVLVQCKPEPR